MSTAETSPELKAPKGRPAPRPARAALDLIHGLRRWELWTVLGWHDIRQRYRRSLIGPFWLTISMGIMIGALGVLYSGLFGQPIREYLPFLALGFIVWGLISSLILDGCTVFIAASGMIRQVEAPLSAHVYRVIWRNYIILAHNIWIYVLILVGVAAWPGPVALLALPGLALIGFNGVWMVMLLGLLSARFRDIPPIIASVVQVIFFLTPVIWHADQLADRPMFVQLNPFYHLIEIVRAPLLGTAPAALSWEMSLGLAVLGFLVTFAFFSRFRGRIAYWV